MRARPKTRTPFLTKQPILTKHRLRTLGWTLGCFVGIVVFQKVIFPHPGWHADTWYEALYQWTALVWLIVVPTSLVGLAGMLWYQGRPDNSWQYPITQLVCWWIVSRGTNESALRDTIERCRKEMANTPLFPYVIEVVTDGELFQIEDDDLMHMDLVHIKVPDDWSSPNGSLFKARALHYALQDSPLPDDAWIVHLDEETHPTPSGIQGIAKFIEEEELAGTYKIGQGALLYHRSWARHPVLTLADMMRTGDDFGRFHFQHRLGITLFGLHGSYIVCRNDVEKEVGFDFGPHGSLTEDAFWALVHMQSGRRSRWCEGYLEEQSTQSLMDFIKQRRRWFLGLILVSVFAPVTFKWRAPLMVSTLLWALAPIAMVYNLVHLFVGSYIWSWLWIPADVSFAIFISLYIIGLQANLDEHGVVGFWTRSSWYVRQIVLVPVFALMEAAGVLYAMLKPDAGFHVVKK